MKSKFIFIAALILIHLAAHSETEPNNTMQQANNLAYNGNESGALSGTDTEDWFVIDIPRGGIFTLNVKKTGGGYAFLYFYDGEKAGNPEISSINLPFGDSPAQGWSLTAPVISGKYYVKVLKTADPVNYQIGASLVSPAFPEDQEPNDTISKSTVINAGGYFSGTVHYYEAGKGYDMMDWYKLVLTNGGILNLKIHKKGPGNTWIHFLDGLKTGNPEISQHYTGYGESPAEGWTWSYPVLAGTYYFEIEGGGGVVDYKLDITLAAPAYTEDTEPNDTITKALTMPVSGSVTGNVHYYVDGKGPDQGDWYKIQLTKGGILNLVINKKGTGDTWIHFRDGTKTGNPEISQHYTGGAESPAEGWKWSYPVLAGIYYFQVDGGVGVVDYKLEVRLATPAFAEDQEPNDSLKYARNVAINDSVSGMIGYYKPGYGPDNWDWFAIKTTESGYL
jgi:hypothetical protein